MRYKCVAYYGSRSTQKGAVKAVLDYPTLEEARAEITRICLSAFPDEPVFETSVRPVAEPKPRRRDYSIRIKYRPGPEPQTRQYDWSNCESEESARDAAQKQFLAEYPGAQILKIESRPTR